MGRRPRPTATHELTGTYRADRHGPPAADGPPIKAPPCPDHLDGLAREAWGRFSVALVASRVLTEHDAVALERLCLVYAEIRGYDATIAAEGATYRTPPVDKDGKPICDKDGNPILGIARVHPAVAARATADNRLRAYLIEFGLTPAARNKVTTAAEAPDADDPTSRYLSH